ncbi:MAG: winged helix-turn-helix transcriptional regulator, partial [Candidatus ainarchaeum sp.]|nr:winged helix-turn-helix transcriptional regulator [Candidatus ainarchaeum sp.]
MNKLDRKDYLLLDILQEGSRKALPKASKELRLHKNSVLYRIARLRKLGVIRNFSFVPGIGAMGKNTFNVYFRLRLGKDNKEKVYAYLKAHPLAIEVLRLSGKWNFEVELVCDDMNHFNDELAKVLDHLDEAVLDYATVLLYVPYKVESTINFEKDYSGEVFRPVEEVTLQALDRRILGLLSDDSDMPYGKLAEQAGTTPDAVFYRIKKMTESGVIRKFVPIVDLW